ncbi:MAG: AI-2E family transporter, partial [Rhodothermales bacterium]
MPEFYTVPQEANSDGRLTAFQTALLAGGFILFLVMLYEMQGFLSPPLVAVAAVMILWPLRKFRTAQAILFATAFLLFMWFLDELSTILLPFVTVYLLAYLFDPFVTRLNKRLRVPRWASALVVTLLLVGAFTLIFFLLVPSLVSQFEVLARRMIDVFGDLSFWLRTTTLFDRLEETGLVNKEEIVAQLTQFVNSQASALAAGIPDAIRRVLSSINVIIGIITVLTVMPVVHFYTLKDYPSIKRRLVELFPTFGGRREYLVQAGGIVGNYLRGQLAISAIAAVNVSVVLIILDMPFALLIGILAGILNMIPNLGIILTNIIAILIGLIFGDPWYWDVMKVVLVLFGQSLLEQTVLSPNILSHQVGLHPVLIILALFVFGYFMGWFGLLIAVPATALFMTFYKSYRDQLSIDL